MKKDSSHYEQVLDVQNVEVSITSQESCPHELTADKTDMDVITTENLAPHEVIQQGDSQNRQPTTERQRWNSRLSFLFASIGSAIGFGNFFRFPYLVFSSGGGSFLIPYTLALFFVGIPLLLMETAIGQFTRRGPFKAMRKLHKRAGGVGFAAVAFGAFAICSYYCVMLAWVCVYFVYTFRYDLPWTGRAEEFFQQTVLQQSTGSTDITGIAWPIFGGLIAVWVIVYICVWRGVKSTGFIAYITVPLPVLLLLILLIRALFLDGAFTGIVYYLWPDFSLLLDGRIWLAASGQIFFSLGVASGVMTAFGSFNKPDQDVVKDNLIICISETLFSLFAGFAVFSILGYMAHELKVTVPQVTRSGIGLAFIVFPDAISLMPIPHLFAILLFITMFTLGIDSAFALVEAVNSIIHDQFPKIPISIVALIVCIAGFISGIPYTLTNGFYILDIVDHYISEYCLIFIGICECIVVGYFVASVPIIHKLRETRAMITEYGFSKRYAAFLYFKIVILHSADEYREKISATSKFGPWVIWSLLIKFLIPILLGAIWLSQLIQEIIKPYSTMKDGSFDVASLSIGSCIVGLCIVTIVFFIIVPGRDRRERHDTIVMEEIAVEFDSPSDLGALGSENK